MAASRHIDYEANGYDHDDPCSRDLLRTVLHGVVTVRGSCDTSTVIADDITSKLVGSVSEVNLHEYLVIVCPTTTTPFECSYSIHIAERKNDMIITNSRLTRMSIAALQSVFKTVSCNNYAV